MTDNVIPFPSKAKSRLTEAERKQWSGADLEAAERTLLGKKMENYVPEPNSGCWLWLGVIDKHGYGSLRHRKKSLKAHRVAHVVHKGPIPPGLVPDHLCRVRCCVNPAHLELVTPRVNCRRGVSPAGLNAAKTHCKHGHEFTPENTMLRTYRGILARNCRSCMRSNKHERYHKLTPEQRAVYHARNSAVRRAKQCRTAT